MRSPAASLGLDERGPWILGLQESPERSQGVGKIGTRRHCPGGQLTSQAPIHGRRKARQGGQEQSVPTRLPDPISARIGAVSGVATPSLGTETLALQRIALHSIL